MAPFSKTSLSSGHPLERAIMVIKMLLLHISVVRTRCVEDEWKTFATADLKFSVSEKRNAFGRAKIYVGLGGLNVSGIQCMTH